MELEALRSQCQLVEVRWPYGGDNIYFVSDIDNWRLSPNLKMSPLPKSQSHKILLQLPPGTYKYKFYVDNDWAVDPKKPKSRDSLCNLLIVDTKPNEISKIPVKETFAFEQNIQVNSYIAFLKTVIHVLQAFRSSLKTMRLESVESLNAKLLCAVIQNVCSVRDFMSRITIPPELYEKKHGASFVMMLLTSIIEQGGLEICKDFLFLNSMEQFEICPQCSLKQENLTNQNLTFVVELDDNESLPVEKQVLDKFTTTKPCETCKEDIKTNIYFETLPKFLILHTDSCFKVSQLDEKISIVNQKGEVHIYEMRGCTVTIANSSFKAITRDSDRWYMHQGNRVVELESFDVAKSYMANGRATMFGYEKINVRYPKPESLKVRKFRSKSSVK